MYNAINREIQQQYYQQNFPNDGQRFVAWYLRNVHLRDMNETKDDVTDGTDDKQIDAIVVDDEKSNCLYRAREVLWLRVSRCRTPPRGAQCVVAYIRP